MTAFTCIGDPARFEIAVRWADDPEPRHRRPAHGGWSTGDLRLTVAGQVLTRHEHDGRTYDYVRWYLFPIFEWLATNWVALLHEERPAWRENSAAPAVTAVFLALRRLIDAEDRAGQARYADVQAWWRRHSLRAADPSALYPDIVFRRLGDDVEVSWTARPPAYAPDGFRFASAPGAAALPIPDVAQPLWGALQWVLSAAGNLSGEDQRSLVELRSRIGSLSALATARLEAAYLPAKVFDRIAKARSRVGTAHDGSGGIGGSTRMASVPAVERLDDAVLMFGGVSPDIGVGDVQTLMRFLAAHAGGQESPELSALVDSTVGAPLSAPYEEGYDLAEQFLEERDLPGSASAVDVRALLATLGIAVKERSLRTSTIRGVAVAGPNYGPAIIVNRSSPYNQNEAGRRFTLAHELCHILFDRSRARRIAHTSGPWAAPGVEKRANAFAAMLLMPRDLVRRSVPLEKLTKDTVIAAAATLEVGVSALVEHLYNTCMIDEFKRDELRIALRDPS